MWITLACQTAAAPTPQIIYVTPGPTPSPTQTEKAAPPTQAEPTEEPTEQPTEASHTLVVVLTLNGEQGDIVRYDDNCEGAGGYDDLFYGAPITVKDGSGNIVKTGSLSVGRFIDGFTCEWRGTISGVPDLDFYSIEVSHRGELAFSNEDLAGNSWIAEMSLG